ncbi:MAG: PilZ domain-containing protein [Arenicellales bacterium WSBS_2016_MAG_OTU3]
MSDEEIQRKLKELRANNGKDKPQKEAAAAIASAVTTSVKGRDSADIIPVYLSSRNITHASYMPFLKNGGVFIPLDKKYTLGEEVFLLLTIKGQAEPIPVAGKVAWINPKGVQGHRPRGIGVEFNATNGPELQKTIEKYLGNALHAKNVTYTM